MSDAATDACEVAAVDPGRVATATARLLPEVEITRLGDLFKLLGDPTRLRLLYALVVSLLFGAVAFGWRTWLQWRRTGDTGLRLHARPGTLQWWAELGFVAAVATGAVAPVAGIVLTAAAQLQMGASWRIGVDPDERTPLVTHGVFAAVRNPIFTAMALTAGGLALLVGNAVALAGLVALVAALEVQVRLVEEPHLLRTHGDGYARYARRAGRFLPGIGRRELVGASASSAPSARR